MPSFKAVNAKGSGSGRRWRQEILGFIVVVII
jgi:hypothetical protein